MILINILRDKGLENELLKFNGRKSAAFTNLKVKNFQVLCLHYIYFIITIIFSRSGKL